ncbi:MAG: hypothetical protein V4673_13360 [Pseudomonadota bacterium]
MRRWSQGFTRYERISDVFDRPECAPYRKRFFRQNRCLGRSPPGGIPAGIRFQETVSVLFRASGSPRVRRIADYADAIRASRFFP